MILKIAIFVILIVLLYIFHRNKDKILSDYWDIYRPSWFPDCRFCLGFWMGFIYSLLHVLIWL